MSQRCIIADNFPVFRAGLARFLVVEDDFSVVGQCDDLPRLYKAAEVSEGALLIFANSMQVDLARLVQIAAQSKVRLIVVLEKLDSAQQFLRCNIPGVLYRDVSKAELIKCLRVVARGGTHIQRPSGGDSTHLDSDLVGERARSRLSKKELQIIGLIVQGYKNKDIALELNNSEQVIKNYLRSIFDKTGVSDRLELALFTIHHRILMDSVSGHASGMPSSLAQRAAG